MIYKIGELARLAGISTRTLRHYDDIGLLKPKRQRDSNYRTYDENQVNMLQHILILKEMGIDLDKISHLMKDIDESNRMKLLEDHLVSLNHKRDQIDRIIDNVQATIKAMKGEIKMSDQQKFEGLKEKLLLENDDKYKEEVIDQWGIDAYKRSRETFKNFTKDQFDHLSQLSTDLINALKQVKKDLGNQVLRHKIYMIHKEWLTRSWGGTYNRDAHYNLVDMYVNDIRFKKYYDQHEKGLTEILRDIVQNQLIIEQDQR